MGVFSMLDTERRYGSEDLSDTKTEMAQETVEDTEAQWEEPDLEKDMENCDCTVDEESEVEEKPAGEKDDDEDEKRKAHEEAEARRKAEWEAKFAERYAMAQAERDRVAALSDDAVMVEAMQRVSKGFEQLTRRSMKDMVSEYVQTFCLSDPGFSRRAMDPKKSMINCVKYINNKAREYLKQEMENNDMKPENGIYGGDVPDDVVYHWAVDYFNDPNAKEDEVKEEKFVPKPYNGRSAAAKSKAKKEKPAKKAEKKSAEKKVEKQTAKKPVEDAQCSLLDLFGATEGSAA